MREAQKNENNMETTASGTVEEGVSQVLGRRCQLRVRISIKRGGERRKKTYTHIHVYE